MVAISCQCKFDPPTSNLVQQHLNPELKRQTSSEQLPRPLFHDQMLYAADQELGKATGGGNAMPVGHTLFNPKFLSALTMMLDSKHVRFS